MASVPVAAGPCILMLDAADGTLACLQVQRRAVRDWDIVKSLFGLVWEPHTQLPALRMVRPGLRAPHAAARAGHAAP